VIERPAGDIEYDMFVWNDAVKDDLRADVGLL